MTQKLMRRGALALCAVVATAALTGCSQFAQLQPVAGDAITAVNNATSDVVAKAGVEVMTWPTCTFADSVYTCVGSTTNGTKITGVTGTTEPLNLTVKIGDRKIYEGPVQDVINEAGRSR